MHKTVFLAAFLGLAASMAGAEVSFLHALTNEPLEFKFRTSQTISSAVDTFQQTGANPYAGQGDVLEAGQTIYRKQCQSCHLKDGTGAVGPNLTDDEWLRPRTNTEVGRFEIIYGGGKAPMQAFGRRLDQDDILKVMAYIDTFRDPASQAGTATKTAAAKPAKVEKSVPPVPFTEAYLTASDNISVGGEIWAEQCRHCHGAKAYPGKAPKLKPYKYKPDFVYRRITDGFRKMPAWKEQYSDNERMQIVAYILSDTFSP